MDPFNMVADPRGVLKYVLIAQSEIDFQLDLPDLRQWRRDGWGVEVRMLQVDCSKAYQKWPHSISLYANASEVFHVPPPEEGHKRRDVPIAISQGLRNGLNNVRVHMVDDNVSEYVLAVLLTVPRSIDELSKLVARCNYEKALNRARSLLDRQQNGSKTGQSGDIECLTSDMLRLVCPITMERIQGPVRGERCKHLQCFSLNAYLTSNRQMRAFNNRWVCPVCTLVLRPADLCFDTYVEKVLAATGSEVEAVIVAADGTWKRPAPAPSDATGPDSPGDTAFNLDVDSPAPPQLPNRSIGSKAELEPESIASRVSPQESQKPCSASVPPLAKKARVDNSVQVATPQAAFSPALAASLAMPLQIDIDD
jgi:hypothetical protein